MALIGNIRKNMWFVFVLLGLALIAFILMDPMSGGGGGGGSTTALSVNGEKVDVMKLQRLESIESNATGLSGNQLKSKVYDDLITRSLVSKEGQELGINISDDEKEDYYFGRKMSPVIQNLFRNRRTGRVDFQAIQSVKQNIENGDVNPNFKALWEEKTKQADNMAIQSKVNDMVSKGIYTPNWMAQTLGDVENVTADIEYVKVPYEALGDFTPSDADYKAYLKENAATYKRDEEGRVVEYVVFDVVPSQKDSSALKNKLAVKATEFKASTSDSLFAITNGGNYINFYYKADELPKSLQNGVQALNVGDVYGPVINERYYSALKLIDKKIVADSAQVSHIFQQVAQGDVQGETQAVAKIDSVKQEIEKGTITFEEAAEKFSQDPSTASKGGDLGKITQGQYFPSINEIAFFTGEKGKLYQVKTTSGVHLVRLGERVFIDQTPKYKVAFINEGIEPSDETLDKVISETTSFVSDNRSVEAMRAAAAKNPNISVSTSKILGKQDYDFQEFGFEDDSRNIVLWAFNKDTDLGDVSPEMYSFRDKDFNYESKFVIVGLQAELDKGLPSVADVKSSIEDEVNSFARGNKLVSMISGKSINDVASMQGAQRDQVSNVKASSGSIEKIGYEPKVVAALVNTQKGQNAVVKGNQGVYLINVLDRKSGTPVAGGAIKNKENNKVKRNISQLFSALRENAKIKDKRMDFGM